MKRILRYLDSKKPESNNFAGNSSDCNSGKINCKTTINMYLSTYLGKYYCYNKNIYNNISQRQRQQQ